MNPAKRNFVVPAAVTFALFALLVLLGSRRPAALARVASPLPAAVTPPPSVTLVDPVETESQDAGPAASVPPVPRIAEPPAPTDPSGLAVPMPPPISSPDVRDVRVVPTDWDLRPGTGKFPGGGITTASMLDSVPRALTQSSPTYPYAAKEAGRSGQVTVEFLVDTKGLVHDPRVVDATSAEFEEAALRAVAKWRFEPGRQNGRIVSFRMAVPVKFSIAP